MVGIHMRVLTSLCLPLLSRSIVVAPADVGSNHARPEQHPESVLKRLREKLPVNVTKSELLEFGSAVMPSLDLLAQVQELREEHFFAQEPHLKFPGPAMQEKEERIATIFWWSQALIYLFHFVGAAVLIAIIAVLYDKEKTFPPELISGERPAMPDDQFRFGLFQCFDDWKLSLFTFCCYPIRWADTLRMMGVLPFYTALAIIVGLQFVNACLAGFANLVLIAVLVFYRQKMRTAFKMQSGTVGSLLEDCCTYMCCSCCAIIQEARQVEEAYQTQHAVVAGVPKGFSTAV